MNPATLIPAGTTLLTAADQTPATAQAGAPFDVRFWLIVLVAMALAPFVLTMVTSFVKLVVVGSIIRTALGTPQVPPNTVITGLALILTVHVMWPVGSRIFEIAHPLWLGAGQTARLDLDIKDTRDRLSSALGVMEEFLARHSHPQNEKLFQDLRKLQPTTTTQPAEALSESQREKHGLLERVVTDLTVRVPAFVISELTEAFQIGFLIFVPFLIIDLVVSNLLLALGMYMLSPTVISLPLKILLFVLIDGWRLIIQGVILGYT